MAENERGGAVTGDMRNGSGWHGGSWRIAAWAGAGVILLLPLIGMQVSDEVNWTAGDFVAAAVLLFGTAFLFDRMTRRTYSMRKASGRMYQAAVGVALATGLFLIWSNLAVGIIGSEDEIANVMVLGVPAVGVIGALVTRLSAAGMARTLFATAAAQGLVAVIALVAGLYRLPGSSVAEIVGVNGFFVVLFALAGLLFRRAAQAEDERSAV